MKLHCIIPERLLSALLFSNLTLLVLGQSTVLPRSTQAVPEFVLEVKWPANQVRVPEKTKQGGAIRWKVGGKPWSGTTVTLPQVGTYQFLAEWDQNGNASAGSQSYTVTLSLGEDVVSYTGQTAGKVGEKIRLAAKAESGRPVTYWINGQEVRGGEWNPLKEGNFDVECRVAGDTNWKAAQTKAIIVIRAEQKSPATSIPVDVSTDESRIDIYLRRLNSRPDWKGKLDEAKSLFPEVHDYIVKNGGKRQVLLLTKAKVNEVRDLLTNELGLLQNKNKKSRELLIEGVGQGSSVSPTEAADSEGERHHRWILERLEVLEREMPLGREVGLLELALWVERVEDVVQASGLRETHGDMVRDWKRVEAHRQAGIEFQQRMLSELAEMKRLVSERSRRR